LEFEKRQEGTVDGKENRKLCIWTGKFFFLLCLDWMMLISDKRGTFIHQGWRLILYGQMHDVPSGSRRDARQQKVMLISR
jgi:hypothetical protein